MGTLYALVRLSTIPKPQAKETMNETAIAFVDTGDR
jgi:hypothetical protein